VEREALLSGRVQPGDRDPAPGSLRLVQAFVNSVDAEHGPDLFDDAAGLAEWLERHGLAADVGPGDAAVAREVREALRSLLHANNGAPHVPAAAAALDRAARRAQLEPAFDAAARYVGLKARAHAAARRAGPEPGSGAAALRAGLDPSSGATLVPRAGGVDGAIGRVLAAAFAAMLDGSWRRLKACPREVCGWAFYDRSTNASATWCSMQVCGGRVKAGAYYRRRRAAGR
jgi:predicted RNA-binding Zn ribbon-like protein